MPVNTSQESIDNFLTRSVENVYPNREFVEARMREGKALSLYVGVDPTGPTFHIGHAIWLRKLAEWQRLGHKVVMLIGDFTAMIGDPTGAITRNFGVMIEEEGMAERGTFVIDPQGRIQIIEINAGGIGRDATELLRKVTAAQYVASHPGEVCPAKWKEGEATLAPSLDLVGKI